MICRLSIYFPVFATFGKSRTPGESNIWEDIGDDTGMRQGIKGLFLNIRHFAPMTTVFIAATTVFIAPSCRVHPIRRRSSWQWRRSSRKFSAQLTATIVFFLYFPTWKPLTPKGITGVFRDFLSDLYNKYLCWIINPGILQSCFDLLILFVSFKGSRSSNLIGSHFPQNEPYCHSRLIVQFPQLSVSPNRNSSASNLIFYPIYFKLHLRVIFFKKLSIM